MHWRGIRMQKHFCLGKQPGFCLRIQNSRSPIHDSIKEFNLCSRMLAFQPLFRCFVRFTFLPKIATERDGKPPNSRSSKRYREISGLIHTASASGPRHAKRARTTWHVILSNLHLKFETKQIQDGGSLTVRTFKERFLRFQLLFPDFYHFHHVIWGMKWAK